MGEEVIKKAESGTGYGDKKTPKEIDSVKEKSEVGGSVSEKNPRGTNDRDAVLERVETEKRHALITAWEENEKAKIDHKAYKKILDIGSWENTEKASVLAQLKQIEEKIEQQKAEYAEKMKNKVAELHKAAEEKRATIVAQKGQDFIKIEESAAKHRASDTLPKTCGCFGC